MSGPKVVVVITPQERMRLIGERDLLIRELIRDIDRWKTSLESLRKLTGPKKRETESKLRSIESLYKMELFQIAKSAIRQEQHRLKKEIEEARISNREAERQAEIERNRAELKKKEAARKRQQEQRRKEELQREEERRREEEILREEQRKRDEEKKQKLDQKRKRMHGIAITIAYRLKLANNEISADLQRVLENVLDCSAEELDKYQKLLNRCDPQLVFESDITTEIDVLRQELIGTLTSGLTGETEPPTVVPASQSAQIDSSRVQIERLLAEIEIFADTDTIKRFLSRAEALAFPTSDKQKALLTDSLLLDLLEYSRKRNEQSEANRVLDDIRKDVENAGLVDSTALIRQIDSALEKCSLKEALVLARQVEKIIAGKNAEAVADSKRQAILGAFAQLGYDVREGMEAAWAKDGRLLLAKKISPDVGVEIGAAKNLDKLQLRAVALSAKLVSDSAKSKEIEESWCSELSRIREILKAGGFLSHIEREIPAGKVPLKLSEQIPWTKEDSELDEQSRFEKKKQFKQL